MTHSEIKQLNCSARNALIHIEDFVKDHTQHEENTDLRDALNHVASMLGTTEQALRRKEAK